MRSVPGAGFPSADQSFHGFRFIMLSAYSVAASRSSGYLRESSPMAALYLRSSAARSAFMSAE